MARTLIEMWVNIQQKVAYVFHDYVFCPWLYLALLRVFTLFLHAK